MTGEIYLIVDRHWLVMGPRAAQLGARLGRLAHSERPESYFDDLAGVLIDDEASDEKSAVPTRVPRIMVAERADWSSVQSWLEGGVHSVLVTDMNAGRLEAALRLVASGERFAPMALWIAPSHSTDLDRLTHRQQEVARLIAGGLPNKEIAARLGLKEATVKVYVSALMRRIGARNRTEVAIKLRAA